MGRKIMIELPDDQSKEVIGAFKAIQLLNWSVKRNGLEHTLDKMYEIGLPKRTMTDEYLQKYLEGMLHDVNHIKPQIEGE